MARRRLIAGVGALALVTAGVAWWALADRLSAEERPFVGTWRAYDAAGAVLATMRFTPDRRYVRTGQGSPADPPLCRWAVRGGTLTFDWEPSPARRAMRPVAAVFGMAARPRGEARAEIAGQTLTLYPKGGAPQTWTRAPAD
jgi:hypothetical protein